MQEYMLVKMFVSFFNISVVVSILCILTRNCSSCLKPKYFHVSIPFVLSFNDSFSDYKQILIEFC